MSAPTASERWNDPHIMAALQLSLRCAAQHHGTAGRAGACVDCIAAALSTAEEERDALRRKGESLCSWIGVLLTSLNVSTPEAGVEEVERHKARAEWLAKALDRLYTETADYITINHLGDVHHNVSMQMARDALTAYRAPSGAEKDGG